VRTPFVVGRLDRRTREVTWVQDGPPAPFPGPWAVESRVRSACPGAEFEPSRPSDVAVDAASGSHTNAPADSETSATPDLPVDGPQLRLL